VAVGFLLYYGRCVDGRILPATCVLASEQASLTLSTMARLLRLLGYVAAHLDGRKIFRASDMLLRVLSDASFLSRPKAGSVAGGLSYLGLIDDDDRVNHPISCHSTRIPVVCSFVAEAEYAGLYAAARIATEERKILANMGHPQLATPSFCDNEVAIGIAADTVSQRMSKATDMRLHWIRGRVRQGQFRVLFIRGLHNVADFFTKPIAVARHRVLAPFIAADPADNDPNIALHNLCISSILFAASYG
jgi:hypothetical protein